MNGKCESQPCWLMKFVAYFFNCQNLSPRSVMGNSACRSNRNRRWGDDSRRQPSTGGQNYVLNSSLTRKALSQTHMMLRPIWRAHRQFYHTDKLVYIWWHSVLLSVLHLLERDNVKLVHFVFNQQVWHLSKQVQCTVRY